MARGTCTSIDYSNVYHGCDAWGLRTRLCLKGLEGLAVPLLFHSVAWTAHPRHEWNFLSTGIIYQSGKSGLSITHGLTKQVEKHVSNVSMSDVF